MKKGISIVLIVLLLMSLLPAGALAARVSIKFGGKVGFMYEDMSVTLKPKLKNISADELDWSSSDTSVATVKDGAIQARGIGRTVIKASGGGKSARCGVVVLPRTVSLEVGEKYSLPYGTVEKYKMQDKSIAQVSKRGVITAKKAGSTRLRVRSGKQTLYIQIEVSGGKTQVEQSAAAALDCGL